MSRKPVHGAWRAREKAVEDARRAVHETFAQMERRSDRDDPATIAWSAACSRFHRLLADAYPPQFQAAAQRLRDGDPSGLEEIIDFLEADPRFHSSGYAKEDLLRLLGRVELDEHQAERLRGVVLAKVDSGAGREFRRYCRLARRLDTPGLRAELERRLDNLDEGVRDRAGWVLAGLPDWKPPTA